MSLDLRKLHEAQGRRFREELAKNVERGRTYDGRRMKPKDEPGGAPLGGRIPQRIRASKVRATEEGFVLQVKQKLPADRVFDEGSSRQPARPYVGISRDAAERNARELLAAVAREGRRLGVLRGRA